MPESPAETWHDVAPVSDVPPGGLLEVVAGDRVLAVAQVDGRYFAVDGICAHQGGPLGKGFLEGCTLTCPWHGWQYDVRDGRQILSQTIRQTSFAVRRVGDRIHVCVPAPDA